MSKTLDQRSVDVLEAAKTIITRAKSENRAMTPAERTAVKSKMDEAEGLNVQIKDAIEAGRVHDALGAVLREEPRPGALGRFSAKTAARSLANKMNGSGSKSLAPSGAEVAPAGLTTLPPLSLTKPSTSLLAAIPAQVIDTPPTYSYLTQTTRTNRAAPVASGDAKPVSEYGLTRVEDRLRVIASLSEPVDRYWLEDNDALRVFVEQELAYGLDRAVEQQLLNGDGTGENARGMLQTSGILAQAWSVDGLTTLRKALTLLQVTEAENAVAVLNPLDFETLSLLRSTTGEFIATDASTYFDPRGTVSPPYGPLALSSWGVPVILTTAIAVGQGVMFDPSAVVLFTDGMVRTEWDSSVGFSTNELTARVEGRFGVAVIRPDRIVSIDMSAA